MATRELDLDHDGAPSEELVAAVRERYGIGPRFARAYLAYWFTPPDRRRRTLDEILALPDPLPMWFQWALSSNWRGREFLRLLGDHLPAGARRYLDVGCGLGGCLVAFAEAGFEVMGIEPDRERVELARSNCEDAGLGDCVRSDDVLAPGLAERLGTFDVITMVDVIEHVDDPLAAMERVASLLSPGGVLVLQMPNKDSLSMVACDGHFNLCAITQLDRPEAMDYHRRVMSTPYDVGHYLELEQYLATLRRLGCDARLIEVMHPPRRLRRVPRLLVEVLEGYRDHLRRHSRRLPAALRSSLRRRLAGYLGRVGRDAFAALARPSRRPAFARRYLQDFWTIGARAPARGAGTERRPAGLSRKSHVEFEWWQWWLGSEAAALRDNVDYYRRFMLAMGGLEDAGVFDGLICLDVGCGPLGSLNWLQHPRAALGLDPLAEQYMAFGIERHPMLYLSAPAERIPLPTGYVDVVFSMNSLDHVDDLEATCREIRRVLKPGGWFIGSLNLDEAPTEAEPWTLDEEFLAEHLFRGWQPEFYRVRPKARDGDFYRYFVEECPPEVAATLSRVLWCRFRVR